MKKKGNTGEGGGGGKEQKEIGGWSCTRAFELRNLNGCSPNFFSGEQPFLLGYGRARGDYMVLECVCTDLQAPNTRIDRNILPPARPPRFSLLLGRCLISLPVEPVPEQSHFHYFALRIFLPIACIAETGAKVRR